MEGLDSWRILLYLLPVGLGMAWIRFREARAPGRFLAEGKDVVLGYGDPLTRPVSFALERGQKIAVRGTNGLGKTTLLRTILGEIPPVAGTVALGEFLQPAYYAQEADRDSAATALENFWQEFPSYTNGEVRAALAKCGLTNEHITSQMKVLSGGENAKVRLAKLMQRDANWLILDEPTNHLDVEAKAELRQALMEFRGTILLVCHEPEFYRDWITDTWDVEDWTLKIV